MKNIAFAIVVLLYSRVSAQDGGVAMVSRFGPTSNLGVAVSTPAVFSIPAGGNGVRNCLKNLDATSSNAFTLRVLDGGTTVYAVDISSANGLVRAWDADDLICGSANTPLRVSVSTGVFKLNYSGFSY